jgi:2-polyprenyl-6-methoxyphenol hydroxylase-like FAD-dependent oxidoreductase
MVLLRTPDHWRVLLPIAPEDERSEGEFTEADVQQRLSGVVDLGRPWQIIQWSPYIVNRRVAQRMRVGRVLLAGDAAHQNSPLGGMGMNSGIQDAISAARRLCEVWYGTGSETLLDEYDENRRRVATEYVQADSHANWLALREPDPQRRAELQAELRATARDPDAHRARVRRSAMIDAVRSSL